VPMKMEQIECSETSVYINQTLGNYPKENKLYSEHGESLKSRIDVLILQIYPGMKLYMIRVGPLSIIRNLFTVHSAML